MCCYGAAGGRRAALLTFLSGSCACFAAAAETFLLVPFVCLPGLRPQVVHGGGNDVLWLQRDFGLFLCNVFDTEKACQVGISHCGQPAHCMRPLHVTAVVDVSCRQHRWDGHSSSQFAALATCRMVLVLLAHAISSGPPIPPGPGLPPALAGLPAAALLRHQGRQEPGAAGGLAPAVRGDGQLATA